jgi:hypothetical protein
MSCGKAHALESLCVFFPSLLAHLSISVCSVTNTLDIDIVSMLACTFTSVVSRDGCSHAFLFSGSGEYECVSNVQHVL